VTVNGLFIFHLSNCRLHTITQQDNCTEHIMQDILDSGFCHNVDEIRALLGHYAASCGNCSPTFQDNVLVPTSRVKSLRPLKMGPIHCPEMSVNNYHTTLHNISELHRSQQKIGWPHVTSLTLRTDSLNYLYDISYRAGHCIRKMFSVKQEVFICDTSAKYVSWKDVTKHYVKNIPYQLCHIKEQYRQQWKNNKSQVQCWTKIKYKNWHFSWRMHNLHYVSM
jgi:hypothetical protein